MGTMDDTDAENEQIFSIKEKPPTDREMLKVFMKLLIPNLICNVLCFLMVSINSIVAGQMEDSKNQAAVGLGTVVCVMLVNGVFVGLNAAQEALTSQAFGNGSLHLCGVYLNRGFLVNQVILVPLALICAFYSE